MSLEYVYAGNNAVSANEVIGEMNQVLGLSLLSHTLKLRHGSSAL
jgi:hypothetical protein